MTTEEQEQFEKVIRERVEAVRKVFDPLVDDLKPGDEPAVVFKPESHAQTS